MPKNMKAIEDDDVQGHGGRSSEGAAESEDTEGHMMGNPLLNQQLARAREQDIQRQMRAQEARDQARPHKK